jgi:hypothetical protein
MMEHWKDEVTRLGYCNVGLMVRPRRKDKIKNGKYPLKNPLFHHSAKTSLRAHYSIIP